jgi:transcriptional regulator with XRE-family HTH domain
MTLRNLRPIRAHLALSQHEVARRAGVAQSRLSYLERGAEPQDPDVIIAIADALGVPPRALSDPITLKADGRVELALA